MLDRARSIFLALGTVRGRCSGQRAESRVAGALATTVQEKVTSMTEENRTRTDTAQSKTMKSAAVTPSDHTERPDGLAFDIETGADMPGGRGGDAARRTRERPR